MQAAGETDNFSKLKGGFGKIDLKPGVQILISITKDGTISVEEPGKGVTATVESRKLCQGILSVYLGPSAVSPEAKASMAAGLPAALALAQTNGDAGAGGTAPVPPSGAPQASSQTEPETGHKYAAAITAYGGGTGRAAQNLVGVGVRKKKVMGSAIKLYTVGLYVDSAGAKEALGSADGTAAALESLMGASVAQTLRIVFESRLINAQRLNESFDDALLKDMQAAGETENFSKLKAGFGKIDLKPGVQILISITESGIITVEEPGKDVTATVESRKLCQGILSVYLGPAAVSPEAKASMAAGLPAVLSHAEGSIAASGAPAPTSASLQTVKEPETGHEYAPFLNAYGGAAGQPSQHLAGVGVRKKKVLGSAVKLYSVGLYVNAREAK